ncbi:MAG TPA: PEGA domain-containing protein [Vicinamibacterales bacterium]|nr:PEGA domain-containing protein [Vicinamibacterales bacterium]
MLHQIGNGALGPVFRAYDSDRDRLVAIKVFRLDLPPERVHQLVGEFEQLIAAELQHPVIAAPRATGIDAGNNAFLAQDFAAADTLDIVLRENGRSPLATTLRVASQLADALDYAADRHVLHGALHPRDILLSQDDIRIVGVGVSRALERVGVTTPVRRPYSAPERINDEGWDRRADVFSLAAIVYELLCGKRVAGTGSEAAESLTDVAGCDVAALQRVFALALAADPNYRFETATAFTNALKDAATPAADEAATVSVADESKPKAKRRAKLRVVTPPDDVEVEQIPPAEVAEVEELPLVIFAEELQEQMAAEPPPKVRLPRRQKIPAPTPVAIETAGLMDLEAPPAEPVEEAKPVEQLVAEQADVPEMPLLDAVVSVPIEELEPPPFEPAPTMEVAPAPEEPTVYEMPLAFEEPQAFDDVAIVPEPVAEPDPEPVFEARLPAFLEPPAPTVTSTQAAHSPLWPIGVAAVIGLAVGFGLGYTVAIRDRGVAAPVAAVTTPAPVVVAQPPAAPKPETPPVVIPPKAPAAAPEFSGRVLVRSTPPGARVFVDGKDRGQTPAAVSDLARGEHRIRIVRDGYTSAERRVVLTPSEPLQSLTVPLAREPRVAVKLAPGVAPVAAKPTQTPSIEPGSLVVESRPPGATVVVDGRAVGTTPMTVGDIRAGNHSVQITRDGYRTWSASVDIKGGEQNRVTASLEK